MKLFLKKRVKTITEIILKKHASFILIIFFAIGFLSPIQAQHDSLNQIDDQNRKQGYWVFTNKEKHLPGYSDDQKIEEGAFLNNRKTGKWTFYFNNGKVKHTLNYVNGSADGMAIFYYKNGNIREQGTWKNNRWVGEYKMYYRNGNPKNVFNYNIQGLKNGKQVFYHENGKPSLVGTWDAGNETNDLAEYKEDGTPNTERFKAGPVIIPPPVKQVVIKKKEEEIDSSEIKLAKAKVDVPITPFDGNGFHEFKDRNGNKTKVGEFENGLLVEGKIYKYDSKGKLQLTKIVRNGKVVKVERE